MLSALAGYLNDEAVVGTDVVAWYRLSFRAGRGYGETVIHSAR